jgi:ketosteroid isomerase-like protein
LDREWGEAVVRRDAEALDRLLADDYTFTDFSNETVSKAREIASVKAPVFDFLLVSILISDVQVRIDGERAVVTGHAVLKAQFDEQDISQRYLYTRTFARRDGRWQIITARIISLAQDEQ